MAFNVDEARVTLGRMADDFAILYVLGKCANPKGVSSDFLMGHALELALKAAFVKLNSSAPSGKHNLDHLARQNFSKVAGLRELWPSETAFASYRDTWVGTLTSDRTIEVPHPDMLYEQQVAFSIIHLVDNKYGLTKDFTPVVAVQILTARVNPRFMGILRCLRSIYRDTLLDRELVGKLSDVFKIPEDLKLFISDFGIH